MNSYSWRYYVYSIVGQLFGRIDTKNCSILRFLQFSAFFRTCLVHFFFLFFAILGGILSLSMSLLQILSRIFGGIIISAYLCSGY